MMKLIAFLLLILSAKAAIQVEAAASLPNEHLLFLGSDDTNSAAIFVASRSTQDQQQNLGTVFPFPGGVQVSAACSARQNRTRRCRKLVLVNSTVGEDSNGFIVVAPLQNAVGLMELRYNGTNLLQTQTSIQSIFPDDCVPIDILTEVDIYGLVVICLDSRSIRFCHIVLNHMNISRSTVSTCQLLHNFNRQLNSSDYQYISNFALFPSGRREVYIFAALGVIFIIRFERSNLLEYYRLDDITCNRLQYYAGSSIIYAYCRSGRSVVRFDSTESSIERDSLAESSGIPIPCMTSSGEDSEEYRVRQTDHNIIVMHDGINYSTNGTNFTSGECYDSKTFLLIDSKESITVFNATTGSFGLLDFDFSPSWNGGNLEVTLLESYFVVQRADSSESDVVLYDKSFLPLVRAVGVPDAVAVISHLRMPTAPGPMASVLPSALTPRPTPNTDSPPVPEKDSTGAKLGIGIGTVVAIVILLYFCGNLIILFCHIIYRKCTKKTNDSELLHETDGARRPSDSEDSLPRRPSDSEDSLPRRPSDSEDSLTIAIPLEDTRGNHASLVSGNFKLPSKEDISPESVRKGLEERTNTEQKRNDESFKVQMVQGIQLHVL